MAKPKRGPKKTNSTSVSLEEHLRRIATRQIPEREMAGLLHALLVSGGDTTRAHANQSFPAGRPADVDQTKNELRRLAKAAEDFANALWNLSAPAASAFANWDTLLTTARITAVVAAISASHCCEDLVAGTSVEPQLLSAQERLAYVAAHVFLVVTGTKPSRRTTTSGSQVAYGPFFEFLTEVFAVRGISASPENCAKVALKAMEKNRAKSAPILHS